MNIAADMRLISLADFKTPHENFELCVDFLRATRKCLLWFSHEKIFCCNHVFGIILETKFKISEFVRPNLRIETSNLKLCNYLKLQSRDSNSEPLSKVIYLRTSTLMIEIDLNLEIFLIFTKIFSTLSISRSKFVRTFFWPQFLVLLFLIKSVKNWK